MFCYHIPHLVRDKDRSQVEVDRYRGGRKDPSAPDHAALGVSIVGIILLEGDFPLGASSMNPISLIFLFPPLFSKFEVFPVSDLLLTQIKHSPPVHLPVV